MVHELKYILFNERSLLEVIVQGKLIRGLITGGLLTMTCILHSCVSLNTKLCASMNNERWRKLNEPVKAGLTCAVNCISRKNCVSGSISVRKISLSLFSLQLPLVQFVCCWWC